MGMGDIFAKLVVAGCIITGNRQNIKNKGFDHEQSFFVLEISM